MILGTLGYMSPEQATGKSDIDERSDIFSFGCILYEATTKRKAFKAETTIDALHKIVHSQPIPITDYVSNIPLELTNLIEKCLEKNPKNRFSKIEDIADVLDRISSAISKEILVDEEELSASICFNKSLDIFEKK